MRCRTWYTGDDLARARDLAVGDALVSIGRALTRLGKQLHEVYAAPSTPPGPQRPATPNTAPAPVTPTGAVPRNGMGPRQLAVLALGGLDTELGLAVSDVMKALNYRRPNAHTVLDRLTDLGYLERVPDEQPTRWRKLDEPGR